MLGILAIVFSKKMGQRLPQVDFVVQYGARL